MTRSSLSGGIESWHRVRLLAAVLQARQCLTARATVQMLQSNQRLAIYTSWADGSSPLHVAVGASLSCRPLALHLAG